MHAAAAFSNCAQFSSRPIGQNKASNCIHSDLDLSGALSEGLVFDEYGISTKPPTNTMYKTRQG